MKIAQLAKFFKSILLAYLIFAGVFLLCFNVSHHLFIEGGNHQEMATCETESSCDEAEAVRGHAFAVIPSQLNILALVLALILFVGVTVKSKQFLINRDRLYIKKWRDHGGGMRLFDYSQRLFAQGILNSKLHNFVTA